jgi:hypothetical protein
MGKITITLRTLFTLCLFSCAGKVKNNMDCSHFKTGSFVFHNRFTQTNIHIERTDSIQTSIDEKTRIGNKCRVQWTSECEFDLTFLAFIINGRDTVVGSYENTKGKTTILKMTNTYYISETKLDGELDVHRDTVWVSAQ